MANCSFIQATEARNIARNNTLIWEEICEIQSQILAGIDANVYDIIVNDGTPFTSTSSILSATVTAGGSSYLPVEATAVIGAGGTNGTGALVTPVVTGSTVTSFIIDNGGDLTLQSAVPVAVGSGYAIGEVLTLDGTGATATTDATVTVTALTTIAAQDETDYAASFTAGTGFTAGDVVTLTDGTKVTIDNAPGGIPDQFTVTSATTIGITGDLATLSQSGDALPAGGSGFALTQQLANQGVFAVTVTVAGLYTVVPTNNPDSTTSAGAGTGATLTWVITAGYAPISVSASVDNANDLIDGQDETNFNGTLPNGDFNAGDSYRIGEVISLVDASTVTIDNISATGVVNTQGQTQANWTLTSGGDGVGGTAYVVNDVITLNDGSTVTVDSIDGNGDVVNFTITTASTSSYTSGATLFQVGNVVGTGNGLGFTLLSVVGNEITVGTVTEFTTASAGSTPYYQTTLLQLSTDGIGSGFTLTPAGNNQVTSVQGTGVTLVVTETGGAVTNVTAAGGSGYLVGATLSFTHPTGINAAATVTSVLAGGVISVITISNGGSGYEQAVATVTVTTPDPAATPAIAFAGTVVTSNGSVTGISIQEGGLGYAALLPTVSVTDATGTGAVLTTNIAGGAVTAINVDDGGSGYTAPTLTIVAAPTSSGNGALGTATIGTNTWGTTPSEYHDVLAGLDSDAVISDQIQYVLDYFTSLGYNIRAQTNSTTTNTMQWQIIW
jgi:hypothetical protein